jgi:transcriptional regulator with GAF, ATPase, and Fis domain
MPQSYFQARRVTGKEIIARLIHSESRRANGPFIAANCGGVTPGLAASDLFGHEVGSFTGAVRRRTGRFEAAQKGTLLLDEIGELPIELQPLLLRVLEQREIERVGGDPFPVDVRKKETGRTWAAQEKARILEALHAADGRIYGPGGAAHRLGLRPTTLYGKMRKHGITKNPADWQ